MATKTPVHVRYGKTLRYYTNRNRESLWFETLGAPYFLAGWKYQYSSETERTLAGRSSRLPDGVGVEILMVWMAELIAGPKPSRTGMASQEKKTLFALPSLVEYSEI